MNNCDFFHIFAQNNDCGYTLETPQSRGYDSVIRIMKSLVCVSIDSVCLFSTFALELEDNQGRERWKGRSWSYYTSYAFRQL